MCRSLKECLICNKQISLAKKKKTKPKGEKNFLETCFSRDVCVLSCCSSIKPAPRVADIWTRSSSSPSSHLAWLLKIHRSRYIPSSPTILPPPACFSSRAVNNPASSCQSSTAALQRRADERVHIWGRRPADNTVPHWFGVFSLSLLTQISMKSCF